MASAFTCDLCNKPVPHEELGKLVVSGTDPDIPGRGRHFFEKLDLCATCAKGAFRAVKALAQDPNPN